MTPGRTLRRRIAAALATALGGVVGGACGSVLPPANLKPPSIAFSELAIDGIDGQRVRFTVRIDAHNPNAVDLPLSNLYFDVRMLGRPLARGRVAESRFTLPAGGRRELPVAFDADLADVRAVLARLLTGPLPDPVWELAGTVNWGASPLPLPFSRRGDVASLRRLFERLVPRGG